MTKNMTFQDTYYWLLELYLLIIEGSELPLREAKMVAPRFSGKSHHVEHFIVLLMLQRYKRVVINYVRARGEDAQKAMDTVEALLLEYSGARFQYKKNVVKKSLAGHNNKVNFVVLNEIKEKVSKTGGKIGVPIEYNADYIITFYEEASQLERELTENHRHSVRGNKDTKMFFVYASNPWMKTHWLIDEMARHLPEQEAQQKEQETIGYNARFDRFKKCLYFRPSWRRNTFLKSEQTREIEDLKEVNYAKWRIVSLGFSGVLTGSLYSAALQKLNENLDTTPHIELVAGIDWGDGKSSNASPTTAYIMGIGLDEGVNIYAEYQWYNNKGRVLTMEEQVRELVYFFVNFPGRNGRRITAYIDNAALGDFFIMCQTIADKMGHGDIVQFLNAYKLINTWERVEIVNVLLSVGVIRFKRTECPALYDALDNCHEVIKTNPTEEMKRQRSHEWTHWIHALEYGMGTYMVDFRERFQTWVDSKRV